MTSSAKFTIGILDYSAGNTTSIRNTVYKLGYRSRLINKAEDIDSVDLLLIPGVGAFPSAMESLSRLDGVIEAIQQAANNGKGIIGVCLGMQLLADLSYEQGSTRGLGLIPGKVLPIRSARWHIGWNSLEAIDYENNTISVCDGGSFYFNHAYEFQAPDEYVIGVARVASSSTEAPIISAVRKNNIYGFQFHPEKSQIDGLRLMDNVIKGLVYA